MAPLPMNRLMTTKVPPKTHQTSLSSALGVSQLRPTTTPKATAMITPTAEAAQRGRRACGTGSSWAMPNHTQDMIPKKAMVNA